ncbi:hypothetical protein [Mesorhizobium sp. RIZ17]|uniref:hypothetical protein n=1 Tax=Mesorhizobium sp. RIZ17 TaxID=3132743 RepID=UPI003DA85674
MLGGKFGPDYAGRFRRKPMSVLSQSPNIAKAVERHATLMRRKDLEQESVGWIDATMESGYGAHAMSTKEMPKPSRIDSFTTLIASI